MIREKLGNSRKKEDSQEKSGKSYRLSERKGHSSLLKFNLIGIFAEMLYYEVVENSLRSVEVRESQRN